MKIPIKFFSKIENKSVDLWWDTLTINGNDEGISWIRGAIGQGDDVAQSFAFRRSESHQTSGLVVGVSELKSSSGLFEVVARKLESDKAR